MQPPAYFTFEADLDQLLTPISAEYPAGETLRYGDVYHRIKEARRQDDASLPQGIYVTDLKRADWKLVERLCVDALAGKSKDLQLAVWLMESWIHRYSFAGAREGLVLLRGLVEGFWPTLFPQVEGGDLEYRLSPLEWVDDKLTLALRQEPVMLPNVGDLPTYTLADKERADHLAVHSPRQHAEESGEEHPLSRARVLTSVTMTPSPFFVSLYRVSEEAREAAEALTEALRPHCGATTPGFHKLRHLLGDVGAFAHQVLREREELPGDGVNLSSQAHAERPSSGVTFKSRADAYRMLLEIAEYLSKIEPHSPTPFLLRRAVSWGSMTLLELFEELVRDDRDLAAIYELLGVKEQP